MNYLPSSLKKESRFMLKMVLLILVFGISGIFNPAVSDPTDKTGSPYFYVTSGSPDALDMLPLKHTEAEVNIAGVIANVKIKQVYVNWGKVPLEAIYVFPGSTRAAVYGMKMIIGERTLEAKIQKREDARQTYEAAKNEGKTASLLEQERPNVFQMNVANIMPGDTIIVEMTYTELLIPEEGVYEFVYPTVVGPRYSKTPAAELASTDQKWLANPYTKEGEAPTYTYAMKAQIRAGMPITEVLCLSHETDIKFTGNDVAGIQLKDTEKYAGNKDFIVRYRLAGNKIQSGVLLYEGEEENFFVAMIQPPKRVLPENIPGREYIFIVDVSGSMNGFPLDISKTLLRDLITSLKPTDLFNVLLFAGGNSVLSERSLPANATNIEKAITVINNMNGGGGTELLPALQRALALPKNDNYSRSVVIATDGYVSVEQEAFDLIRNNLGKSNFFSFGIGSSVNRYIIEGMARVGMGEPFVITTQGEAKAQADKFRKYISSPVLTNIKLDFAGLEPYDYNPVNVPDVLAERPIIITGKYKGKPLGNLTVRGVSGGGTPFVSTVELADASRADENSALQYLWARDRIQLLSDYAGVGNAADNTAKVTELGLKYNLLTAHTSFVAVDSEVRNQGGKQSTITTPLPLPSGVSDMAVGSGSYSMNITSVNACYGVSIMPARTSSEGFFSNSTIIYDANNEMETYNWEAAAQKKAERKEARADADSIRIAMEEVLISAEQMPEYPGGQSKLEEFLKANLIYPKGEREKGIEGIVYISFTIGSDGKARDVVIQKSITKALDKEAIRLIKLMPAWVPGMQDGKTVNVTMTLPISFKL